MASKSQHGRAANLGGAVELHDLIRVDEEVILELANGCAAGKAGRTNIAEAVADDKVAGEQRVVTRRLIPAGGGHPL